MWKSWANRYSLYFTRLFYVVVSVIIAIFILAFFYEALMQLGRLLLLCLTIAVLIDFVLLFMAKMPLSAQRFCTDRWSNGDDNLVSLVVSNHRPYRIKIEVNDELPPQLVAQYHGEMILLEENETRTIVYKVKPVERGEYHYGIINAFLHSPLGLMIRHLQLGSEQTVAVYPSYLQLRRFGLLPAATDVNNGSRQVRKLGSSLEFEQIKEYVSGDDYRTINWQATARKQHDD